ncbi:MAG: DUF2269 family protein [Hyphococcus sp.]
MIARKVLKILHSIAACGLIGGVGCYMLLLVAAPHDTPAAYADLRGAISVISDYVLLPSLMVGIVSGLLSMVVHQPFLDKGWVWIKAATGILMFKGVLTIVSAKAAYAEGVAQKIAAGEAPAGALDSMLALEWWTLVAVMAISIANVVLGVWRPRLMKDSRRSLSRAAAPQPAAGDPGKPSVVTPIDKAA